MKPIHILLAEDNDGDILLITEALEAARFDVQLSVVKDGKEAIAFLTRHGDHKHADRPDLMLLDINMPKMNGHEVLLFVKEHQALKQLPVIILTTSGAPADIAKAYNNYANCYITKPVDAHDFLTAITTLENFWISVVKLPGRPSV